MLTRLSRSRARASWPLLAAAFVLLFAGASSQSARAQDWTYTARNGDNLWVLAQEYLTSMQHWERFRALNNVPFPRRMQPGTKIRFPIEWLRRRPASAVIDASSGTVSLQPPGKAERPARVGDTLGANARIVTANSGSAVIRFADGSNMLVRPGSDVVMDLLGVFGRSGMIDTRARLQRGRVETSVPAGSSSRNRLEIITPSASAVVRGTAFRVSVGENPPLARTEVLTGRVGVANDVGRVGVKRGTGVVTRRGAAPGKPRALLPAPDLSTVPGRVERLQPRIHWTKVEHAAGYRAQIATLGQSSVLLLDEAVDVPRVNLPDLPDGRYQLRIRAVDAVGLEGLQTTKDFELDARPEPPVTLEPRPVQTVRVTTPTFTWTQPKIAEKFRLQIASSRDFSTLIADAETDATTATFELERGAYFWRIATIGPGPDQGPFSDIQIFTISPAPPAPDVGLEQTEDSVLLRWSAGTPGQTYEVELASSEDFKTGARIEATEEPQLSIERPEEELYFRVRIIDTDGYRGPFGTVQKIAGPAHEPWYLLLLPILLLAL